MAIVDMSSISPGNLAAASRLYRQAVSPRSPPQRLRGIIRNPSPGASMRWSTVSFALLFVVAACVGDGTGLDENGNPIGTPPPDDSVTLSGDVQPIFTANCAVSGCHA